MQSTAEAHAEAEAARAAATAARAEAEAGGATSAARQQEVDALQHQVGGEERRCSSQPDGVFV